MSGYISERGVETAGNQNTPIIQPDGHRIRLQGQILRYLFFGPIIFIEIVEEDQILIVRVPEKVDLRDRLELIIEILVCVAV